MTAEDFATYYPVHFGSWARNATLLVPPESYLSGDLDLFRHLAAISSDQIHAMQLTIARHARRLVFGLDHQHGDALDVLLIEILRRSRGQWAGRRRY